MHRLLRLGGDPPAVLGVLGQIRAAKQNLGDKMKGNEIVQLEEENAECFSMLVLESTMQMTLMRVLSLLRAEGEYMDLNPICST